MARAKSDDKEMTGTSSAVISREWSLNSKIPFRRLRFPFTYAMMPHSGLVIAAALWVRSDTPFFGSRGRSRKSVRLAPSIDGLIHAQRIPPCHVVRS